MSYIPTVWASGDIVTSTKLNKLENGVANAGGGGGAFIVYVGDNDTLDKTWQEIYDAFTSGTIALILAGQGENAMANAVISAGYNEIAQAYLVGTNGGNFSCESADDYPAIGY